MNAVKRGDKTIYVCFPAECRECREKYGKAIKGNEMLKQADTYNILGPDDFLEPVDCKKNDKSLMFMRGEDFHHSLPLCWVFFEKSLPYDEAFEIYCSYARYFAEHIYLYNPEEEVRRRLRIEYCEAFKGGGLDNFIEEEIGGKPHKSNFVSTSGIPGSEKKWTHKY